MNAAIDYIEENLSGKIDMAAAASKACCSEYHFTRIFSFIAGMTLNEYIRNRRLTMAGFKLQRSNSTVTEIANMYEYTSPNSFTRAFFAFHGVLPSKARNVSDELKTFPRLVFEFSIKTVPDFAFRIEEEGERKLFGVSLTTKKSTGYETVPAFLDDCEEKCITNKIVEAGKGDEKTLLKSVMWDIDDAAMKYMLCLDIPEGGVSKEFETITVPARTWAVFPLIIENPGEDSIISVWKRIWTEWFTNSEYELDSGPHQERCYWTENGKMKVEAWIPVIKNYNAESAAL